MKLSNSSTDSGEDASAASAASRGKMLTTG
jgi:hypothetical protein